MLAPVEGHTPLQEVLRLDVQLDSDKVLIQPFAKTQRGVKLSHASSITMTE